MHRQAAHFPPLERFTQTQMSSFLHANVQLFTHIHTETEKHLRQTNRLTLYPSDYHHYCKSVHTGVMPEVPPNGVFTKLQAGGQRVGQFHQSPTVLVSLKVILYNSINNTVELLV